jgi:16S rRNA processing protein RimM
MTQPAQDDPWVVVAVVMRPHGLRGTFRLKTLMRDPEEFLDIPVKTFKVRRGRRIEGELTLAGAEVRNGVVHAWFDGIDDRSAAELFVNAELVIHEDDRWEAPEGSYYVDDLTGLEVRDAESGEVLGRVSTAIEGPAHDYLVLDITGAKARETYLPIDPAFLAEVNVAGFVRVRIPEGLVDR